MYSNDRWQQLQMTLACLKQMKYFEQCQKTIVVDGNYDRLVPGFAMVQVPRIDNEFSWSNMWDAGVCTARHNTILYLDCDRLLPATYLEKVLNVMEDDVFVFTSRHFIVLRDLDIEKCMEFVGMQTLPVSECLSGLFRFDPRYKDPAHGPGKNVMSGSTAFTKRTYLRLGGVDPWYKGHGAFADTDFHMTAASQGCRFVDLDLLELHYHHTKLDLNRVELDDMSLKRMGLDNFIYYCHKWHLPITLAENLAFRCSIVQPARYVDKKLKQLKDSPRNSRE